MAQSILTKKPGARPSVKVLALVFAVLVIAGLGIAGYFYQTRASSIVIEKSVDAEVDAAEREAEDDVVEPSVIRIHVDGAVASPGLVTLEGDDVRVDDAIHAAGGLTEEADLTGVNLAAVVADGSKIYIPRQGEVVVSTSTSDTGSGTQSSLININTATLSELCELNGVGEATAQAIIDEREANGPYESVEDLMRVSGIGEKKLAKIKPYACV